MTERIDYTNYAIVEGRIVSDFEYSHEVFGEGFYCVKLKVSRLSHNIDTIPLLVSERLIDVTRSCQGQYVIAKGQLRSFNKHVNQKSHLILSLFVRELELPDQSDNGDNGMENLIYLDGFICKKPVYRVTPFGREIADITLAVNRSFSKSDYIPCILWGRNARYAQSFPVGSHVHFWGRIQSREYQKKIDRSGHKIFTAYEVSVYKMEYFGNDSTYSLDCVADKGNAG